VNPRGHNFRITRERVEHGWALWAHCTCSHTLTARNYDDLTALITDHYDDARRLAQLEQEEQAHQ
jgi:hypothetical protein